MHATIISNLINNAFINKPGKFEGAVIAAICAAIALAICVPLFLTTQLMPAIGVRSTVIMEICTRTVLLLSYAAGMYILIELAVWALAKFNIDIMLNYAMITTTLFILTALLISILISRKENQSANALQRSIQLIAGSRAELIYPKYLELAHIGEQRRRRWLALTITLPTLADYPCQDIALIASLRDRLINSPSLRRGISKQSMVPLLTEYSDNKFSLVIVTSAESKSDRRKAAALLRSVAKTCLSAPIALNGKHQLTALMQISYQQGFDYIYIDPARCTIGAYPLCISSAPVGPCNYFLCFRTGGRIQ